MTPVEFKFISPNGDPISNTEIEIQLSRSGFDGEDTGVIMPRLVTAMTDEAGEATVDLLPSPIMYYVTVVDSISDAALHYKFYVPEISGGTTSVRLQDIIVDTEMSGTTYDEAALLLIHDAKANAMAAAVAALASKNASETAAASAATSAATALRALTVTGPTAPVDPLPNSEWVNTNDGKRYAWTLGTNGQYSWVVVESIESFTTTIRATVTELIADAGVGVEINAGFGTGTGSSVASMDIPNNSLCYTLPNGQLALSGAAQTGKPAQVFVRRSALAGSATVWYGPGSTIPEMVGLVPGKEYFMSTVEGQMGNAPVAAIGSGVVLQRVGRALSANSFLFSPSIQLVM